MSVFQGLTGDRPCFTQGNPVEFISQNGFLARFNRQDKLRIQPNSVRGGREKIVGS
ncbi:MAG: hypothetical protein HC890_12540 [Chloroflexaceae bacterium]|nr:hypothetical protein [Chloroflexaceae bacterium]